jgi:hypothetical protein
VPRHINTDSVDIGRRHYCYVRVHDYKYTRAGITSQYLMQYLYVLVVDAFAACF